jgi:hypothetical protein
LYTLAFFIFMVKLLLLLTLRIFRLHVTDPDFAKSFLCTLTPAITGQFSAYTEYYQSGEAQELAVDVGPAFDNEEVFTSLVEAIILVDSFNTVVALTPSASHMLAQPDEGAILNMATFIETKCMKKDVKLPPPAPKHFEVVPSSEAEAEPKMWRVHLYPVKKFMYAGRSVSYAVRIVDIDELANTIVERNHQANLVKVLAAHLVPLPIAQRILDNCSEDPDALYNRNDQRKVICATFMITSPDRFDVEDLSMIQDEIRGHLSTKEAQSLSYSGRSLQMFRVFTGHFDTEISKNHPGMMATFAQRLITSLRALGRQRTKQINVFCGIHSAKTSGCRFRSEIRPNEPLIFEFYESPVLVSTLVAAHGRPNTVNVSRDYRQDIFGQDFDVNIADEIQTLVGEVIQMHTVRQHGTKSDDDDDMPIL